MIGYPFNSHVTYDEHDMPVFDRAISSVPLKNLIAKLFSNGVLPNPSTNLQVVTGSEGMSVIVHAGFCIINGGLKLEDEDKTLVVQASDNTHPRIDTVVMRWNDNDEVRACDLYVVEGTASANPVRPTLTRTESIYELGLADIFITAGSTTIDSFRITDTRYDMARCGVISSISEFDTSEIYAQIQADMAEFKTEEQEEFLDWFDEMKDQLSEDAAGNLQLEIDEVNGRFNGLTEDVQRWEVRNVLPDVGREGTVYLLTGEQEAHYDGDVDDDDPSIINDDMISTGTTYSSNKIQTLLNGKVNAEVGKVLSSNDYTNGEKQKLSNLSEVIANPPLIGTESTLNGLQIGSNKFKLPSGGSGGGTDVEANPVLSGTEDILTGLRVGNDKFRVPSGGNSDESPVDFSTIRTFAVIGDSYASGQIYKANLTNETVYALSWPQVMARRAGNECINMSFGGAMCSTWLTNASRGLTFMLATPAQDLYLIQMGINDSRILGTNGLGTIEDISTHASYADYPNTFYGNYGKIVAQVKEHAPSARIVLMTFAYAYNATESAYNDAIKTIANYFEIPYIDVNLSSFYAKNGWWDKARVANHPVALGYSAMAKVNEKLIESNMKNNESYWTTYGFSDTPAPVEKTLLSISASKTVVQYQVGETLDTSDITVIANYNDSTTANVTSSAVIDTSSVNMSIEGTYPINVTYSEGGVTKSASVNIAVGAVATPVVLVDATYDGTIQSANSHLSTGVSTTVGSYYDTYSYEVMGDAANGKNLMYRLIADGGIDESEGVGFSFEITSSPASSPSGNGNKTKRPYTLVADGQWHNIIAKDNSEMKGVSGKYIRTGLWSTSDSTATFPYTIDNAHIQIGYMP